MKTIKLGIIIFLGMAGFGHAKGYFEGQVGAIRSPQAVFGLRGGIEYKSWDISAGYWTTRDASIDDSKLVSNSLDLNTLDIEAYRLAPIYGPISLRVGGGIGYTISNLSGPDHADADISYTSGAGFDYAIRKNVIIGILVRGFFYNTNTHRTLYGSHAETLSNGQEVEVIDVFPSTDSVNFNSILATIGVKFLFD